ncbi:MAG TPA: RsmB/NOP family class I SAM-dependent RNA methyltransferase [Opitutaceae bacterium]|nr:RsmB/NOP family class I SAM-dependent RNA methyltransferase [Opitutaceae bacterium]
MSPAANQARVFLTLLAALRPHWRRDPALPTRIQTLLARHREFGSRDRRLYRELIYTTLRHLPWIERHLDTDADEAVRQVAWLAADTAATRAFRATLATGEAPSGEKSELLPPWFRGHCPEIFAGVELETQLRRAPLWLRLQTSDAAAVFAELDRRGWRWRHSAELPSAIEILDEADVTTTDAWQNGQFEVQDLGSQLILESIGIETGGHWLDACAGAGGKTLQLSRLLGHGRVDAFDIRPAALTELERRAERAAGALKAGTGGPPVHGRAGRAPRQSAQDIGGRVQVLRQPATDTYDGVLVDAPCSGSGTWRRAPHLKWTTTEAQIVEAARTQRHLLDRFSALVRPGGRLVYATCSLSPRENEDVVTAFLAARPHFRVEKLARTFRATPRGPGLLILPSQHDTDGFFLASLRRI